MSHTPLYIYIYITYLDFGYLALCLERNFASQDTEQ